MFVGVVARGKVVVTPARITMIYGALYEDVWLWRYSGKKWVPGMKNICKGWVFCFFNDPNRIRSSVRKSNKKFLPWGGGNPPPGVGWGGDDPLRIRSSFRKCKKKFLPYRGGGGNPPPPGVDSPPLKYKVAPL